MKYLYPFECEKKGLSSPGELQAAIDSNRREGRRPGYTSSLYNYSSPAPHSLLSSPKMRQPPTAHNGLNTAVSPNVKRNKGACIPIRLKHSFSTYGAIWNCVGVGYLTS